MAPAAGVHEVVSWAPNSTRATNLQLPREGAFARSESFTEACSCPKIPIATSKLALCVYKFHRSSVHAKSC